MNSAKARQRADELQGRLKQRLEELNAEQQLSSLPPVVAGGALIVPAGLLSSLQGTATSEIAERARERSATRTGRRRCRDGHRTRAWPRPGRDAAQQQGLRHREQGGRRIAVVPRGKGTQRAARRRSPSRAARSVSDATSPISTSSRSRRCLHREPAVRYVRRAFQDVGDLPSTR